mgnify:CR=1 FL=1
MSSKHNYHGSIPSKYEAVIMSTGTGDKNGFGCTDTRFKTTHYKDCPGPGAYEQTIIKPLIDPSPSHSVKGYGNSFLSKTPKDFECASSHAANPGPGSYNIKGIEHIEDHRPTSAFIQSGDGRVPYPDPKVCKKNIPGPLDYNPNTDMTPALLKTLSSGTFKSQSKRDSFLARNK